MGVGALLFSRDGLGYHPSFVLMYEKICATAKISLEGITNLQTALEGYLKIFYDPDHQEDRVSLIFSAFRTISGMGRLCLERTSQKLAYQGENRGSN